MVKWYDGFDPYGQFYNNKVDYYLISALYAIELQAPPPDAKLAMRKVDE